MSPNNLSTRGTAMAVGAMILAASAFGVIEAAHQALPHAVLTVALSVGVFAGACTIGAAWRSDRRSLAIGIGMALFAGEAFAVLVSAERIVAEREVSQAGVRAAAARYDFAVTDFAKSRDAHDVANAAAITEAAKVGCKTNCRAILDAQVTAARVALDNARQLLAGNPKPQASGTPLADRLGFAAWIIDMALAGLLAVGANGLAAALIAFGAHGGGQASRSQANDNRAQPATDQQAAQLLAATGSSALLGVTTRLAAEADLVKILKEGVSLPCQDALAARWGVQKGTVSRWLRDFERRGVVRRAWDGRSNQIRAA